MSHSTEFERGVRDKLEELDRADMKRRLQLPQGISFSSNDYLGLAAHPRVKTRMIQAIESDGCGATGSRLLSGNRESFTNLERRFAQWKGTEAALFFGSGYLANLGVLSTFLQPDHVVFSDELNHASLIDGLRLSRAHRIVFPHVDVDGLVRLIERNKSASQKFLVTESVFSMDGDEAPLAQYAALCRATDTMLIVDEAHAVGIRGVNGAGLIEEAGIGADVFLSINPAGKALGMGGAFVAGPSWAIDYLLQLARPFIFSTAPPPAMAAALDASLDLITEEPERRARLLNLSATLRRFMRQQGITIPPGHSQIVPLIIGDSEPTIRVAELLQQSGYDVRAIRPPSVPPEACRLRLSVNVNLDEHILEDFSVVLAETLHVAIGRAA